MEMAQSTPTDLSSSHHLLDHMMLRLVRESLPQFLIGTQQFYFFNPVSKNDERTLLGL